MKPDKPSSSSVAKSSSSQVKSSSSSVPEGHCAVSKREIFVGDEVEWYVAGPDGSVLSAKYNWMDLGADGVLVSGEKSGTGEATIVVKYTTDGAKEPMVQFAKQGLITCQNDEEGDQLLVVKAKAVSSSSEEVIPESSSSGEKKSSSSKANPGSSSSFDPGIIDL